METRPGLTAKANRGVTLLEVLLVLLILAGSSLVLLIKLPVEKGNHNLAIAGTQLLEELREARFAAMSENTWYRVRFYPVDNSYIIACAGTKVKEIKLPEGIVYLNRPYTGQVTFYPSGIPDQGTTVILGTADGSQQRSIIVAPVGGRIREE